MRKLLSIVLCLVMVFCFTVPAMAAEVDVDMLDSGVPVASETLTNDVNVTVKGNPVYKVVVTWDEPLEFVYNNAAWDPDALEYTPAAWEVKTKTVNVANRSNASVTVDAAVTATNNGVTITLDDNQEVLDSAVGKTASTLANKTFTLTAEGIPSPMATFAYGQLTLTISK